MKEITDADEIKKLMKSKDPVAIFFYAAWCHHCKAMQKPWSELANENDGKITFVKMESSNIPEDLGIGGYPHFVLVKNGRVGKPVEGEMSKEDLKKRLLGGMGGGRRRTRARRLRRTIRKSSH